MAKLYSYSKPDLGVLEYGNAGIDAPGQGIDADGFGCGLRKPIIGEVIQCAVKGKRRQREKEGRKYPVQ